LYVLVVVDVYSRYAWVFFLEDKGGMFGFVRDLVLRLKNERHGDAVTTRPKIIPYYLLNHSIWSLSDNKEVRTRSVPVVDG
jgi:hypothetical protein